MLAGRIRNQNIGGTSDAAMAIRQALSASELDIRRIPIGDIEENPVQTRLFWDAQELKDTGATLEEEGQLQAIGVIIVGEKPNGDPRYRILFGTGRLGGARVAGRAEIDARVFHDVDPDDLERQYDIIVAENAKRKALTPYEDCRAVAMYKDRFGRTFEYIANRFGISPSQAENRYYAWRDSNPEINGNDEFLRKMLKTPGTMSFVQLIRRIPKRSLQKEVAEKVVKEGLSAREVRTVIAVATQQAEEELAAEEAEKDREEQAPTEIPPATPGATPRQEFRAPRVPKAEPISPAPEPARSGDPPAPTSEEQQVVAHEQYEDFIESEPAISIQLVNDYLRDLRAHTEGMERILEAALANPETTDLARSAIVTQFSDLIERLIIAQTAVRKSTSINSPK